MRRSTRSRWSSTCSTAASAAIRRTLRSETFALRRVAPEHVDRLRDTLAALGHSSGPQGMDLPGFRLHALKGRLKGHYAVSQQS